jgi:tetratricopeptide (TPR) repeat protein
MVLGATAMVALLAAQPQPIRGLTGAPGLARAYDAIFDARFDEVPRLVGAACPPAPPEACRLLDADAVWWQIQLDPLNTRHDADFQTRVEAAIDAAQAWTVRDPLRAEAWFYLGGAYGARVQWRVLRGSRLAAARDGKRIKEALEQSLALDPMLTDAYFGLGLYHYYADVAPAVLKMLRWLFLLPGGDRAQGLAEMLRARASGALVHSEADYQLHIVYLWYEKQPQRAVELLQDLQVRHPHNPYFLQAMADIQDFYIDDTRASLRTWQTLLDEAQRGEVAEPRMAEAMARVGIASQYDQLSEGAKGLDDLRALIASRPQAPTAIVARAQLQLGRTLEHLGRRADADTAYRAAIAAAGPDDPLKIASQARSALRAR